MKQNLHIICTAFENYGIIVMSENFDLSDVSLVKHYNFFTLKATADSAINKFSQYCDGVQTPSEIKNSVYRKMKLFTKNKEG